MQVSARRINKNIEKQMFAILYQVINDLKSEEEVTTIFNDLLSETEKLALAKRLAIATFLDKGRSYDNIRDTLKVSSATIASVQEMMGNPGFQLALRKVKAEEWADQWGEKISSLFRSVVGKN